MAKLEELLTHKCSRCSRRAVDGARFKVYNKKYLEDLCNVCFRFVYNEPKLKCKQPKGMSSNWRKHPNPYLDPKLNVRAKKVILPIISIKTQIDNYFNGIA